MDERGQTQLDFAIGVGMFLLVVIGVLTYLPGVFAAYDNPVGTPQREEADRVDDALVEEHRAAGAERTLVLEGEDGLGATLAATNFSTLRDDAGVPSYRRVNVTVVNGSRTSGLAYDASGEPVVTGHSYDEQPAATTIRVIRFEDSNACDPLCRMVVRVW